MLRDDDRIIRVAQRSSAPQPSSASNAGSSSAHSLSLVTRVRAKRSKAPPVPELEEKDPNRFAFRGMISTPKLGDSDWKEYVRYRRTHRMFPQKPDKSKRAKTKPTVVPTTTTTTTTISNSSTGIGNNEKASTSRYLSDSRDDFNEATNPPNDTVNVWEEQNESWTTQSSVYKPIKKRQLVEVYAVDSDSAEETNSRKMAVPKPNPSVQSVIPTTIGGNSSRIVCSDAATIDLTGPSDISAAPPVTDLSSSFTSGKWRDDEIQKAPNVADPQFLKIRSKWTGSNIANISSHSAAVSTMVHENLTTHQPAVLSSGKNESNLVQSKVLFCMLCIFYKYFTETNCPYFFSSPLWKNCLPKQRQL